MPDVNRDELLKRLNKYSKDKISYLITIYSDIYDEISLETLAKKIAGGDKSILEPLRAFIENLIFKGKLKAKIKNNLIVFRDEVVDRIDTTEESKSSLKDETKPIDITIIDDILKETINTAEDLDRFLKEKLASMVGLDYDRVKIAYEFYKEGRISREELFKHSLKLIGDKMKKGLW